jgi:hypothetical protein
MGCATREVRLTALTHHLEQDFATDGWPLPSRVRIACGWPSTRALAKRQRLGECCSAKVSQDQTAEIFISPSLACPLQAGATLVHELVHAAVGLQCGHKGAFKQLAHNMGLEGPIRSISAGERLRARLQVLLRQLDVHFINTLPVPVAPRHSRESGNPGKDRTGTGCPPTRA